ncbi:MAG: hypothetical protein KDK12_02000 [Rhodobacteraceae bacterium]|nr:hypothetical protein [Paracoccaceae bacterium]
MAAPALSLIAWDGEFDVDTARAPRARIYYDAMQDRHVPVTPRLALALAQMETSADPSSVAPWGVAYQLAGRTLGLGGTFGRTEFWSTLTPVFVLEIAEPLLRKAAVISGSVPLTMPGAARAAVDHDAQCIRIETALTALLNSPEAGGIGFWSRAGMALLAAYRDRADERAAQAPVGMQRVTSVLPGLVFELEPERPATPSQHKRKIRQTVRSERVRAGIRPREGGVDGIASARGFEEVGAALMTTFAYPKELLLLKLLEEGYLTTLRPPFRNPERDLLSITMAEAEAGRGPAALAKAAWIDAAARLVFILARLGRAKSELGWCDLREDGPVVAGCSAQGQPDRVAADGWALSGSLRRTVIARSTLTPAAFVERPSRTWKDGSPERRRREAMSALLTECGRVAHGNGNLKEATRRRQTGTRAAQLGTYNVVLALDVVPGQSGQERHVTVWPSDRAAIARRMDLPSQSFLRVGRILLPPQLDADAIFRVASDIEPTERAIHADPSLSDTEALQFLVGQLSDWFVEQTVRALDD